MDPWSRSVVLPITNIGMGSPTVDGGVGYQGPGGVVLVDNDTLLAVRCFVAGSVSGPVTYGPNLGDDAGACWQSSSIKHACYLRSAAVMFPPRWRRQSFGERPPNVISAGTDNVLGRRRVWFLGKLFVLGVIIGGRSVNGGCPGWWREVGNNGAKPLNSVLGPPQNYALV